MTFKAGDRVRVKAGAKIYSVDYNGDTRVAEKSQVVTLKASGVVMLNPAIPASPNEYRRKDQWQGFRDEATGFYSPGIHYYTQVSNGHYTGRGVDANAVPYVTGQLVVNPENVAHICIPAYAWGTGAVEPHDLELVQKAEDVVVKERKKPEIKDKPVEFRNQLTKGSKWIATKDLQCYRIGWTNGRSRQRVVATGVIKAGEEFTVSTKPTTVFAHEDTQDFHIAKLTPGAKNSWKPKMANGKQAYFVSVKSETASGELVVYEIEQSATAKDADRIVPIYYVLDTETNKYMGKATSEYNGRNASGYYDWTTTIPWKDTVRGARKFKRLGDVRAFALNGSGYYDNLRGATNLPEWVGGRKSFDVKDSWIIVEVDQLTNKEVRRIELVDTFKRTWSLREITQQYGSSARTLYSELDKKGKLDEWKYIVSFSHVPHVTQWATYVDELSDKEVAEIDEMLSVIDKSLFSKAKSEDGYAIAVKDAPEITLLQLSYAGNLQFAIIDIETLTVTVKEKQEV